MKRKALQKVEVTEGAWDSQFPKVQSSTSLEWILYFSDNGKKLNAVTRTKQQNIARNVGHRVIILNRGSMFAFQWREFSPPLSSAHRLLQCYRNQWEIGDAAIPSRSPPPPPPATIGPLANERAVSCDIAYSGRENLHHFLPVLLRGMLPLFNIMTVTLAQLLELPLVFKLHRIGIDTYKTPVM